MYCTFYEMKNKICAKKNRRHPNIQKCLKLIRTLNCYWVLISLRLVWMLGCCHFWGGGVCTGKGRPHVGDPDNFCPKGRDLWFFQARCYQFQFYYLQKLQQMPRLYNLDMIPSSYFYRESERPLIVDPLKFCPKGRELRWF